MAETSLIDAQRVLREAGLREEMKMADFGAGRAGHFVFPAANIVGDEGEVFAVDVAKDVLPMIDGRSKLFGIVNLHTLWADMERVGAVDIPEHSLDLVLLVNNLWCMKDVASTLGEVRRVLKLDGQLLVVDWRRRTDYPVAPPEQKRLDAMQAEARLLKAGFVKIEDIRAGEHHWGMLTKVVAAG